MTESKFTPLLVRMPPKMHRAVTRRAKQEDRTMASLVRIAITRYLEASR